MNPGNEKGQGTVTAVQRLRRFQDSQFQRITTYLQKQRLAFHGRLWLVQVLVRCIPYGTFGNVRSLLYRRAGFRGIGNKVYIRGTLDLRGGGDIYMRLHIGEHTTINTPCTLELNADITIGKRVGIGHHTLIITSNHLTGPATERRGRLYPKPVVIGDGAWIGANVSIAPGVSIGPGAFVTFGSVVTKDVPANAKVAGNPATIVTYLNPE